MEKTTPIILIRAAVVTQATITDMNIINEISNHVNKYREMHGVPKMTWDNTIANFSQQWSNYLLANNVFVHSGTQLYGENLAYLRGYGTNTIELIKMAIDLWYEEINLYDFDNPGFSSETGHATALLWKSSTKFGVGFSINKTKQIVDIVFNTSPPGNVLGHFKENIFPLVGTQNGQCPPCPTLTTTKALKSPKSILIKTPTSLPVRPPPKKTNSKNKDFLWDPWYDDDCYYGYCDWDDWDYPWWWWHHHHDWYDHDWEDYDDHDDHWDDWDRSKKIKGARPLRQKSIKGIRPRKLIQNPDSSNTLSKSFDKLNLLKSLYNILDDVSTNKKRTVVETEIKELINSIGDLD
jgi:hypothetical protein